MKKIPVMIAAILALTSPISLYAAGQTGHGGERKIGQGRHQSDVAHVEIVDGVKATFKVISMKEHMAAMEKKLPKDMKETHHITAEFKDAKTGKTLTEGEVIVKVLNPDKTDQTKELKAMQWHFGGDFDFSKKGKYSVMCRFLLKEGKISIAKFSYDVK
jgi:L-ascorbate metabolism protein UlaG (beta-lactamase superfamily)